MDQFNSPSGSTLGFYGAPMPVGGIFACFFGGQIGGHFGRRLLVCIGALVVIATSLIQNFSVNFPMFISGKLFLGIGVSLQQLGGPILVTKLAHPKQRVAISSFYNTSINIGIIIGSWITFGTFNIGSNWSWKIPCLLQVVLPAYQAVMVWFVLERPRRLVSYDRIDEARQILIQWHGNGVEGNVVKAELQGIAR